MGIDQIDDRENNDSCQSMYQSGNNYEFYRRICADGYYQGVLFSTKNQNRHGGGVDAEGLEAVLSECIANLENAREEYVFEKISEYFGVGATAFEIEQILALQNGTLPVAHDRAADYDSAFDKYVTVWMQGFQVALSHHPVPGWDVQKDHAYWREVLGLN